MATKPPEGISSRDKILWAAATMLGERPGAALSVRAVAARAGVSTGSLQHHFPTKRELMDEVMTIVYDLVLSEENLHDTSIPARERLIACMQRMLVPPGTEHNPRQAWRRTFDHYINVEPSEAAIMEFFATEREIQRRIEYYLRTFQEEGSLPPGDNTRRARLLVTILNGLSIAQAFPTDESRVVTETDVLHTAVDCILTGRL